MVASLASANPTTRAASREAGESGKRAFLLVVNDGLNSRLDGLQVGLLEANQADDALEETEGESNSLVTRDAAITIEIDGAKSGLALRLSGDGSVGAIVVGLELGGLRGPGSYETAALSNSTGRPLQDARTRVMPLFEHGRANFNPGGRSKNLLKCIR